jgi:hypothetical protein
LVEDLDKTKQNHEETDKLLKKRLSEIKILHSTILKMEATVSQYCKNDPKI